MKIKFRAKNDRNEWVYSGHNLDYNFFYGLDDGQLDRETLGQFTGLEDKDGKEIYDGDIVDYPIHKNPSGWGLDTGKWEVKRINYNFCFCSEHKNPIYNSYRPIKDSLGKKCKVVGNIFENPEFIKK